MNIKRFGDRKQLAIHQIAHTLPVGLCINCAHQRICTFQKTENKLFCEEYE